MTMATDRIYRQKAASRGLPLTLLVLLGRRIREVLEHRRTIRALQRLDDRGLRDIGVTRTAMGFEMMPDELRRQR
ncbi:DUF1127 domain-containing protein [Roseibium polysiphoniae]|uniref:DUF1127 domain-containing protein n=1 Tax=Roseibium polysiphoniae TaxID=2571221 RepID=A0A944CGF7_9HYPH|nr:DUF1127 domain-containing protein [Roseibium polysiphoniae]MBS8262378.1 DUF1127 domain-containing protein [Roseibium polysiphoniae]